jgi:hypothetical protein
LLGGQQIKFFKRSTYSLNYDQRGYIGKVDFLVIISYKQHPVFI